jgi:hypothetical protein
MPHSSALLKVASSLQMTRYMVSAFSFSSPKALSVFPTTACDNSAKETALSHEHCKTQGQNSSQNIRRADMVRICREGEINRFFLFHD